MTKKEDPPDVIQTDQKSTFSPASIDRYFDLHIMQIILARYVNLIKDKPIKEFKNAVAKDFKRLISDTYRTNIYSDDINSFHIILSDTSGYASTHQAKEVIRKLKKEKNDKILRLLEELTNDIKKESVKQFYKEIFSYEF